MKHTAHKAIQKSIYASLFMSAILANSLVAKETKESLLLSNHALQTQGNVAMLLAKNTTQAKTNSITTTQQDSKETGEKNTESQSQDLLFGRGQPFIGAEVALVYRRNYLWQYNFNAGVVGGYQYYFPEEWQISGFRHGIRGYGNISYATWDWTFDDVILPEINFPALFVRVGADWTLEFNPRSKYVWGFFAGISFDYMLVLQKPRGLWLANSNRFGVGNGIGVSLNMLNHHKFELLSFYGYNGIGINFSLRYLFMF